ncbi:MAG: alanine--tRNA ligase [Candidatus Latescibacteria bacterium]|nr:alanine--tRNA ligase [Candidatus Latescibacterota bacterium]
MKTSADIRREYLRFFEEKGHTIVPSAPVAPQDDATLLFTNAGMNQFKDVFLGTGRRDYRRAVDTQKCIRVSGHHNDLEEVGFSAQHHTFFEMLGNWSFGDYFKREAIAWAWELLTGVWQLPRDRICATVFGGDAADGLAADEEAEALWTELTDLPAERVLRLDKTDNFWQMGETGPCGPCSEVHYYLGDDPASWFREVPDLDGPDTVEIWNLVFIQFNRDAGGVLHPLPDKHVDTGMGFERICTVLQGVESTYDTDLFQPILAAIGGVTRKPYSDKHRVAMRVIADHIRTLCFAIADGVLPSNEGRGYVLRRILRRAARYGRTLGMHDPFIHGLVPVVVKVMGGVFPEVAEQADHISRVIRSEEEGFGKTLDRGLEMFEVVSSDGEISGRDAFRLYDTFGFPIDLTQLMCAERGLKVDLDGFQAEMAAQQARSREAGRRVFASQEAVSDDFLPPEHSVFVGYDRLALDTVVVACKAADGRVDVYLRETPFYAEAGGQVGDRGRIHNGDLEVLVEETFRSGEGIVHRGRLTRGCADALEGANVEARVDGRRRMETARNHTATHLLHEALRQVLGNHVNQAGSLVAPDRLRFDFNHFEAVTPAQQDKIARIVNRAIRRDLKVDTDRVGLEEARRLGARMLFSEKYGDIVRTVRIGDFSLELCGGTHVGSTGQIGMFQLTVETGTAAGIRRVEAVTGTGVEALIRNQRSTLAALEEMLSVEADALPDRVNRLITRGKDLERTVQSIRSATAGEQMRDLAGAAVNVDGVRVVATAVQPADMEAFREMGDRLRETLGSGVGVLGAALNGKASLIAVVTDDLIQRGVLAGNIVKAVAKLVGGGGQAGGRHPEKMSDALAEVPEIVRSALGR